MTDNENSVHCLLANLGCTRHSPSKLDSAMRAVSAEERKNWAKPTVLYIRASNPCLIYCNYLNRKYLLSHKHSPTTIFLSSFNILLLNHLVKEFLNSGDTDAGHFFHISQCKRRLCSHSIQYFSIIWCTESNPFTIIPPYIFIIFTHKEYIIIYLCSYQFIEVFQKRFDVLNISMCTICRYRADLNISLMQCL